jgi:proteasome accessory factor C
VGLRTSDTAWLRRLLWRLGGHGVVVSPPDVADEVRQGAEAGLAAYADVPAHRADG